MTQSLAGGLCLMEKSQRTTMIYIAMTTTAGGSSQTERLTSDIPDCTILQPMAGG